MYSQNLYNISIYGIYLTGLLYYISDTYSLCIQIYEKLQQQQSLSEFIFIVKNTCPPCFTHPWCAKHMKLQKATLRGGFFCFAAINKALWLYYCLPTAQGHWLMVQAISRDAEPSLRLETFLYFDKWHDNIQLQAVVGHNKYCFGNCFKGLAAKS